MPGILIVIEAEDVADGARSPQGAGYFQNLLKTLYLLGLLQTVRKLSFCVLR